MQKYQYSWYLYRIANVIPLHVLFFSAALAKNKELSVCRQRFSHHFKCLFFYPFCKDKWRRKEHNPASVMSNSCFTTMQQIVQTFKVFCNVADNTECEMKSFRIFLLEETTKFPGWLYWEKRLLGFASLQKCMLHTTHGKKGALPPSNTLGCWQQGAPSPHLKCLHTILTGSNRISKDNKSGASYSLRKKNCLKKKSDISCYICRHLQGHGIKNVY